MKSTNGFTSQSTHGCAVNVSLGAVNTHGSVVITRKSQNIPYSTLGKRIR